DARPGGRRAAGPLGDHPRRPRRRRGPPRRGLLGRRPGRLGATAARDRTPPAGRHAAVGGGAAQRHHRARTGPTPSPGSTQQPHARVAGPRTAGNRRNPRGGRTLSRTLMANRVTVAYGRDAPVLRDVSAIAQPGRVLAVTGPSGAGKTTLLWALAGLLRPVEGVVTVDGVPLRNRDHGVAERIVLIPQDNGLAPILTAAENISVALLAVGAGAAD